MIQYRLLAVFLACGSMGATLGYLQRPAPENTFLLTGKAEPQIAEEQPIPGNEQRGLVLQRADVSDPAKAIVQASFHSSRLQRKYAIARLAEHLSSDECRKILDDWLAKPNGDVAATMVMEIWAEKDPDNAVAFLEGKNNLWLRYAAVRGWARKDVQGALAWVMDLPPDDRLYALIELQTADFESDTPNPAAVMGAALKYVGEAKSDDGSFASRVMAARVSDLWRSWARHDPSAAESMARSLGAGKPQQEALVAVLSGVIERDPKRAVELFGGIEFPDAATKQWRAAEVAASLAGRDLQAAIKFAEKQSVGMNRSTALAGVAGALLSTQPEKAIALADAIPAEDSSALSDFLWKLAGSDPVAALQLTARRMDQLEPDSAVRKDLQWRYEQGLAGYQAVRYSQPMAEHLAGEQSPERQRPLITVLQNWTTRDLPAATAWANALPEGSAREYAMSGLAEGRANQSIRDALTYVQTLKGRDYIAGIEGFAAAGFRQDPDGALAWLRTIPDPAERQQRLMNAWQRWVQYQDQTGQARKAAERWRDTSPDLTTEERKVLVSPEH